MLQANHMIEMENIETKYFLFLIYLHLVHLFSICRNISRVSDKSIQMSLDILQTREEKSSFNIYFFRSVEITKENNGNNDDLTNNDNLIAPGPSLNDKV